MTARKLVVSIGGPAYTGVVRIEHATYVASLAAELFSAGFDVRVNYQANTLVGDCRAGLLTSSIDKGHDVFISIDSDVWCPVGFAESTPVMTAAFTLVAMSSLMIDGIFDRETALQYWDAEQVDAALASIQMSKVALLGLVCAQKDHKLAIWKTDRARMALEDFQRPIRKCWATGMGYTLFNVGWYRRNRALARRFDNIVDGASEDYSHCRVVANAGGELYTALATTYHKPWGTDEVLLVSPQYSDAATLPERSDNTKLPLKYT